MQRVLTCSIALFDVSNLSEIPWNRQLFANLVLDPGEKRLLLALIKQDRSQRAKLFDDFTKGKGGSSRYFVGRTWLLTPARLLRKGNDHPLMR